MGDPRPAWPDEHDVVAVAFRRLPDTIAQRAGSALVGDLDGGVLRHPHRKHLRPPLHDAIGLREKAMSADVDAVSPVAHGARNAADMIGIALDDDWLNVSSRQQLISGGQPGRACADNDCDSCPSHVRLASRLRSSHTLAAHSHANFGIKGTLATL